MTKKNDEILEKLTLIVKLLYIQTRAQIEDLKKQLLKTSQQKKAYSALNGRRTIKEIAQIAGYSDTRTLERLLPEWGNKGLILSIGRGPNKKYLNIENLEV